MSVKLFRFLCLFISGLSALVAPLCANPSLGLPVEIVSESATPDGFPLCQNKQAAPLLLGKGDYPGVNRAATDLQADVERVTGVKPILSQDGKAAGTCAVIIGTLGKSELITSLVQAHKINVDAIAGKWESFVIATVAKPLPGVDQALVIAGSDKRGTIYGIYEISEQIGVSPWYWWADVPVQHRDALSIKSGTYVQGPPAVKYRGIFLNDEAPALTGWAKAKFGGMNQKVYTKVFELLLRLRGNYLWPAMWSNAFNEDDPEDPRLADEYGVVMGTSHHEPMMRAQKEWTKRKSSGQYGNGEWNYATNEAALKKFWEEGVQRNKNFENIVTMGMRGDGDKPMVNGGSMDANVKLLEKIVADQRAILAQSVNPDLTKIPQLWALYKEVFDYYNHGMRVPDDMTLLWCDDNWGNIRRLPTPEERKRSGGAGIYYHFDYVGVPRSYRWLNTNPLPKIWDQMNLAYRYGADRIWIVNVGDLKPMEIPIEFFLRMAWNPDATPKEKIADYQVRWATREFGAQHATEIADIVSKYAKYNGWRKPELLEPGTFSLTNYREAERASKAWDDLDACAEQVGRALSQDKQDAYFELVLHPVKACATVADMYIAAGRNALFAKQGRASTNAEAARVRARFKQDQEIGDYYNNQLADGKWLHMMDQTHIGYVNWDNPKQNVMPKVTELTLPDTAEYGVAVDGSAAAWPGSNQEAALPAFDSLNPRPSYLEVFAKGTRPIQFSVTASQPWIILKQTKLPAMPDQRVWVEVDWSKAPGGESRGSISVTGGSAPVTIKVSAFKASDEQTRQAQGAFGGLVGPTAIAASSASQNVSVAGARWEAIPDYGRDASAMEVFPVTAQSVVPPSPAPRLEFPVFIARSGKIDVEAVVGPTLAFVPGHGLRLALSLDDQAPQIVEISERPAEQNQGAWGETVKDNARTLHYSLQVASAGRHILKLTMVDPAVVVEKLILHDGKLPESYLGPPDSIPVGSLH